MGYFDMNYERLVEDAESGNAHALYILGRKLDEGRGVKKDRKRGIAYMLRSAELGYAPAQNYIGYLYNKGDYFERDDTRAAEWFAKAADQGLPKAMGNMALMYKDGDGVEMNRDVYLSLIRKAARKGHAAAQFELAESYYDGLGKIKDYHLAVEWYEKAAKQGYADAQYCLGYMYETGKGVPKDLDKAVEWYSEAMLKGDAYAALSLGMIQFYLGHDMKNEGLYSIRRAANDGCSSACYELARIFHEDKTIKDPTEARYWLYRGIEANNVKCLRMAAELYRTGSDMPHRPDLTIKCYEKAAELDDAKSMFELASIFEKGELIPKDMDKALELYHRAGWEYEPRAQCRLGDYYMYEEGNDGQKALIWYRWAARNGNTAAMNELGRLYEQGIFVTQDMMRALYWYNRAYMNGDELAKAKTDMMMDANDPFTGYPKETGDEKLERRAIENDDASSCYKLGYMYETGEDGHAVDYDRSRLWFDIGARLGDSGCIDNMGYIYYFGKGVEKDLGKAAELFKRAAEMGSPYSQRFLGCMYRDGEYFTKDDKEAHKWLSRAAEQGLENAKEELKALDDALRQETTADESTESTTVPESVQSAD
ncbi:Sel1 domain-containing protein [methanogenic archaeon mixed culture ISO4-G1]|nr:Sel1 domain-containing protein [methanogenic archaeon mixed culture ISO4-G1]